jgi:hypothetical protein
MDRHNLDGYIDKFSTNDSVVEAEKNTRHTILANKKGAGKFGA